MAESLAGWWDDDIGIASKLNNQYNPFAPVNTATRQTPIDTSSLTGGDTSWLDSISDILGKVKTGDKAGSGILGYLDDNAAGIKGLAGLADYGMKLGTYGKAMDLYDKKIDAYTAGLAELDEKKAARAGLKKAFTGV